MSLLRAGVALNIVLLVIYPVPAQIIPDSTLGTENSAVTPDQIIEGFPSFLIDGGARRGASLFHSFQEFNIGAGQAAYFANPAGVEDIFSRVTGANPSHLLGQLGILGNANLFFLNPNGLLFGPNANLDLNGSFLATTASFIEFPGGYQFSTKNPQGVPLLTVSIPIGLGFIEGSGGIQVQGTGHNLVAPGDPRIPNIPLGNPIPRGLSVRPGKTIGLVGGKVDFMGGIITAPSGRIEIGSLASGQVKILLNSSGGFSLAYEGGSNFQDIALTKQSLLNASGLSDGNIQIVGKNLEITDASLAFIENQGPHPLGAIKIDVSDSLTLTGTTEVTPIFSGRVRLTRGLVSQTISSGKGADIEISAQELVLQDSGRIYLSTFGSGAGGNLKIETANSVQILGVSAFDPSFEVSSLIATSTAGSGPAGNIELATRQLSIEEGGLLTSTVFNSGTGGDLIIKAAESMEVIGYNPNSLIPSNISSSNQGSGQGGNLQIETKQLISRHPARARTTGPAHWRGR